MEATDARRANRSAVLRAIVDVGQTTRAGLGDATGLHQEAVSEAAHSLITDRLIMESAGLITTGAELGLVCGIDLGASNCRFLIADMLGNPVMVSHDQTPISIGAAALADWVAGRAAALITGPGAARGRAGPGGQAPLRAAVVGLPGMVAPDGMTIGGAPNVPQIEGEVFAQRLTRAFPAPVHLYNDADLALLGELRFGAGRGLTNVVMFTIGAGLGAGVLLDGALLRGRRGLTGEFGYLPIGPSGETIHDLLSGNGLLRQARALHTPVRDAAELFSAEAPLLLPAGAADLLDPVLERFDRALVLALTAATVAYEPSAIIVGGGLSPAVARRLDMARQRLAELLPGPPPDLRLASLGDLSGTLGALTVAYQSAYRELGVSESDAAGLPPDARLAPLWLSTPT
jgi:predicted NBD/HSP70 family sugar kinase